MPKVRTKHSLAPKADLLGHALRRKVVGIRDEVDALHVEILERMPGEKSQRTSADPTPALGRGNPVPHRRAILVRVEAHPDASDDATVQRYCQLDLIGEYVSTKKRTRVIGGVRVGDQRNPERDLRVVAPLDDGVDVILRPGPETKSPSGSSIPKQSRTVE